MQPLFALLRLRGSSLSCPTSPPAPVPASRERARAAAGVRRGAPATPPAPGSCSLSGPFGERPRSSLRIWQPAVGMVQYWSYYSLLDFYSPPSPPSRQLLRRLWPPLPSAGWAGRGAQRGPGGVLRRGSALSAGEGRRGGKPLSYCVPVLSRVKGYSPPPFFFSPWDFFFFTSCLKTICVS